MGGGRGGASLRAGALLACPKLRPQSDPSPGPQPDPSPGPQPHTNLRRAVTQACDEVDAEEDDAAVTALTARIFADVREAGEEARYEGD